MGLPQDRVNLHKIVQCLIDIRPNNMKRELTLHELSAYLPWGVNVRLSREGRFNLDGEYVNEHANKIGPIRSYAVYQIDGKFDVSGEFYVTEKYSFDFDSISEIELLIRPLSDLTSEITHNGETFIPIEKLGYTSVLPNPIPMLLDDLVNRPRLHPYWLIEQLLEWHFDIFGLIQDNLAIDIKTIK